MVMRYCHANPLLYSCKFGEFGEFVVEIVVRFSSFVLNPCHPRNPCQKQALSRQPSAIGMHVELKALPFAWISLV